LLVPSPKLKSIVLVPYDRHSVLWKRHFHRV